MLNTELTVEPGLRRRPIDVLERRKPDFHARDPVRLNGVFVTQRQCRVDRAMGEVIARIFLKSDSRIDHAERLTEVLDQRFRFGAPAGEGVEKTSWSKQIGAPGPSHSREDRALHTHARRVPGMR